MKATAEQKSAMEFTPSTEIPGMVVARCGDKVGWYIVWINGGAWAVTGDYSTRVQTVEQAREWLTGQLQAGE